MATVFSDLQLRNEKARADIRNYVQILKGRESDEGKALPQHLLDDLEAQGKLVAKGRGGAGFKMKVVDPLFFALRQSLATTNPDMANVAEHEDGSFGGALNREERLFTALYGLLSIDNQAPLDFSWKAVNGKPVPATDDPRFHRAVAAALGEYSASADLFEKTFDTIAASGGGTLSAARWAKVVRTLRDRGITAAHSNLDLITEKVLGEELDRDQLCRAVRCGCHRAAGVTGFPQGNATHGGRCAPAPY